MEKKIKNACALHREAFIEITISIIDDEDWKVFFLLKYAFPFGKKVASIYYRKAFKLKGIFVIRKYHKSLMAIVLVR